MSGSVFRKKSLERISSPEQLNDYIRVSTPSLWIALIATLLLLAGAIIWGILGSIDIHNENGGVETVHPIVFVTN